MFKLNGTEYSLEEVTSAAESSNLSVDEYVNEFGLETVEVTDETQTTLTEGKTSDVATVDAAVTSKPDTASESTGLNSENYFSVPPSEILEEGKFVRTEEGVRFAEEGEIILAEPEKGLVAPIMLDEFDIIEYKKQQQQDENQAAREIMLSVTGLSELTEEQIEEQKAKEGELKPITEFEEAQRISKGQIEFRKQAEERAKRIAKGDEFLSYQENIANNVANGLRLLTSVDDNARWLWYWAGSQDSDLLRNMYGDEKAEEILAKNRTGLAKATADIDAINAMQAPTIGFTDLPQRKGSEYIPGFGLVDSKITGGVSAAIGAVTQTGASIGLQVGTGGVGLASTMIAESVKDYNETKANELGINLEDLVLSGEAETFVPAALGALSYGLERLPNNRILDYIKSIPTSSRRQMVSFMNTVGANGFQEIGQLGIETFNTGLAEGKTVSEAGAAAGRAMVSKEGFEAGLQGAFGSAGLALSGRSLKASGSIRTDSENKRIQNYINQISSLENSKFQKNITAEEIGVINTAQQEIKNNIVEEVNKNNILVASFTDEQLETVNKNTDFLTESASKINETEASTDLSRQDKDIIINAIEQSRNRASQEIYNIRNEAEAFVGDLRKARKATETLQDVEIKDFKTTEEINKFLENQDQNLDTKASEQQAFVIQNPETGKQTVVINRSLASKEAIKHEVGHVLLYETVKNRPETAINLGNALLTELDKIDAAQIKDSNFKKRMEQYSDQTREVQMEEAITLFSDAINTGDIKFQENIFTKLGDRVRRIMQRFGVDIKFNTGRDVYNFVKDYNKSLEKGDLSLAQVRAAAKGVEGELVGPKIETFVETPTIKESKITPRAQEFIRSVDEGILTNENLVQTINSPSSTPKDKFAAIDAVVEKNWPVISSSIKFDPTGNIPMSAVKEAVTEQIQGIFPKMTLPDGTKISRPFPLFKDFDATRNNKVTTILGPKFLGRRQAEILERAKTINARTQGVDLSEARGIAAEETKTQKPTTARESKLIDVRQSPRVKRVLPTLEKEIKLTEGDSSVEILNNNRSKFASEIYNIPESKIEKVDNLTYSKNKPETSELGRIQQDFSNAQETERSIKTMPEFNVTTMESTVTEQGEKVSVSPEVRGRSMKIGQTVLDFFYEPYTDPAYKSTDRAVRAMAITNKSGRSKGKTTQTKVYRLKPEFKPNSQGKISPQAVSKAREWAGIDVDLNELSKNERRNYATKLAAWARMRGGQVALSVADKSLPEDAPKQQRADTRAGRSRLMFSKQGLLDVTQARDINAVAKILNISKITVNDNNRVEKQKQMEEAIVAAKIPSWMFEGSKFGAPGRRKVNGVYVGLPNKGGLYYGSEDVAYQKALALAKQNNSLYDIKPPKRVPAKKANTEKMKQRSKDNLEALDFFGNKLADAVAKKQMPLEIAALFITSGYQATYGIIKIVAPFRYFSKNPQFSTNPKAKANQRAEGKGEKYREEHNPPASVIGATLIYGIATNNMSSVMPDIKNNYYQTNLSKADDFKLDDAKLDATLPIGTTIADNPAIRFIDAGIDLNSIVNYETGQTMAEELGVALKPSDVNIQTVFEQNKILKQVLSGDITAKTGQNRLDKIAKLKSIPKASVNNNNENNTIKFSKEVPNQEVLDNLGNADQAMANARNPEAPVKKIRVFDFDDTLARSNSNVLYEMPDGTTGKLNATQFAERAGELEAQGAEFDFSEFSKVVDGKRGPVFKAIENIVKARGSEDVFILTARPANAAGPIKEFMDALGVNLPIENIVGLGDGKAEAKARWMTGKAAEGYNDFFFVDDAYKNVKAVQDALNVFDVKSKVQQAKIKFSKKADLDRGFNDILENKTGIASEKEYGRVKAEVAGAGRGRLNFFIPPSAEDFVGLLYATLGKGKLGDQQMAWYKTHLLNPYARAMNELSSARIAMMNDYKLLKKQLGIVPKDLRKKVPGEPFTREQAIRVYVWDKQGMSIPGISKKDQADLSKYVSDNAELQVFADQLIAIQKGDQYAGPKEGWPVGTITTDMLEGLNTTKRAKYLEQWQANADVIFSEKNLNKLEAAYGKPYRLAMENMLQRMKSGRNRNFQGDTLTGRVTDWLTGSIGTIMFFNTRSAILQTISSINFVNFTDNNILAAGKAFANQKQYWSDFMTLMNSDFLKERRGGLRINVNEADIADMAKKGGAKGVINKLLEFGFTPTQIADSFAIASGGSAFYRNRIKSLKKQGMTDAEAEAQAFIDFRETAEESQQSSRPDRISMQQAGPLGRLVLAFANTPAQYARLIKKAASDLKNGRGDAKTNISKIIYYGVAQNLLFNALQQALFAFAFDDDEEDTEEQQKKYVGIANGMMDSLLRGMGIGGAAVSVGKNAIIRIINEMEKKQPKLEKVGYEITKISPPISAKLSRINQAARSYQWDKKEMKEKGWSLDNPAYLAGANVVAALTNVPLDRAIKKTNNVVTATSQDLETWERLALLGGWQDWEIGIDEEKPANKPQPRKSKSKSKFKKKKF